MPRALTTAVMLVAMSLAGAGCGSESSPSVSPEMGLTPPGVGCQGTILRRTATALAAATQTRWEGSGATFTEVEAFYDRELAARGWAKQSHDNPRTGELIIAKWSRGGDVIFVTSLAPTAHAAECSGFATIFVVEIVFG